MIILEFMNEMHMESNRIGFGKFKSAKADVATGTLALDNSSRL